MLSLRSALLFPVLCVLAGFIGLAPIAEGTYSIIACDKSTAACGVAVQTNNLAVGASVPYARAGVGAIASQFETNPAYGIKGLALLAAGKSPEETLRLLLSQDGNFEGEGPEARQVGIVSIDGRTAVHSGKEVMEASCAGARQGNGYSIQGNGLAGPQVVESMETAFLNTKGTLGERLLAALAAGDAAGGQKTGRESAALVVKTPAGWPIDIDLRVDHSADPVGDLQVLFQMQMARQQVSAARQAAQKGQLHEARALLIGAVARAPMWPRVWIQAARVAANIDEPTLAVQYLNVAFSENPKWTETEIGEGRFFAIGYEPLFHRWVSVRQEQQAMTEYWEIRNDDAPVELRLDVAKKLLEVGHSNEALALLKDLPVPPSDSREIHAILADAFTAQRKFQEAIEECGSALKADPNNELLKLKMTRLQAGLAGTDH